MINRLLRFLLPLLFVEYETVSLVYGTLYLSIGYILLGYLIVNPRYDDALSFFTRRRFFRRSAYTGGAGK